MKQLIKRRFYPLLRPLYLGQVVLLVSLMVVPSTALALSQADRNAIRNGTEYYDPAATGCAAAGAPGTPGPVVLIGDSIGVGMQSNGLEAGFAQHGWSPTTVDAVVSRPLSGSFSPSNGLQAIDNQRAAIQAAHAIVVELGTNPGDTSDFGTQIDQAIDKIRAANASATIYWVDIGSNPANLAGLYGPRNKAIFDHAQTKGYTVIDWFKVVFPGGNPFDVSPNLQSPGNLLSGDHVHPSSAGYGQLVNLVVTSVTTSTGNTGPAVSTTTNTNLEGHVLPADKGGTGQEQDIDQNGRLTQPDSSGHQGSVTFSGLAKAGQNYRDYYIAMRWRYVKISWSANNTSKGSEDSGWYGATPRKVLVTNPRTGKSIIAAILEFGPAPWTGTGISANNPPPYWQGEIEGTPPEYHGRVSGFPPKAMQALGATMRMGDGSGDDLIYAWAPDQSAEPGPTSGSASAACSGGGQ